MGRPLRLVCVCGEQVTYNVATKASTTIMPRVRGWFPACTADNYAEGVPDPAVGGFSTGTFGPVKKEGKKKEGKKKK